MRLADFVPPMRVAGVTGSETDAVVGALVRELRERGRVAVVSADEATADGGTVVEEPVEADSSYVLGAGGVRAVGPPRSLAAVLDELVPAHDYALVTGHPESGLPHVVLGEVRFDGETLVALDLDDPELEDAVDAIEALEPRETLASLVARAKESPDAKRAGALATFTGRVRERDGEDDDPTEYLEFETYEGVAEERMAAIEAQLEARDGVHEVVMHHKTGVVEAGEDIVFVVVLAGHREEAFATVSDGIDRLKDEVPIFKKEVTVEGEFWAHER